MWNIRRENKGGIIFDYNKGQYLYIEEEFIKMLEEIAEKNGKHKNIPSDIIEQFKSMQLITTNFELNGRIIKNHNPKRGKLVAPLNVFLQITNKCNLKCIHCFTHNAKGQIEQELEIDEIYRLIDDMSLYGVGKLTIGGGEPLVRKDIWDVIDYANKNHIRVSLTTNGTLITDNVVDKFKERKLDYIKVSLDGSEEVHDQIRGDGSFRKATEGIKKLVDAGIHVGIRMVVSSLTYKEVDRIHRISKELGCSSLTFSTIRPSGEAVNNKYLFDNISKTEYQYACDEVVELNKHSNLNINIAEDAPYIPLMTPDSDMLNELLPQFGCPAKGMVCEVDAYGNMSPCGFLKGLIGKSLIGGNIKKESIIDIWNNSSSFEKIRNIEFPEKCGKCSHYGKCLGGCRTRAYSAYGTLAAPDPLCYNFSEGE